MNTQGTLCGLAAAVLIHGGRPKLEEMMAYSPALTPKAPIQTQVEVVEA